jgi:hypothetical protein
MNDIKPREALRGGRVECYVHYKKINTKTHCIRGFDLTSLYPSMMLHNLPLKDSVIVDGGDMYYINKIKKYAETIKGTAEEKLKMYIERADNEMRCGFLKCKILAPRNLNMPCLSCKINGKLLNVLCRTCGEQISKDVHLNSECNHTYDERALYGFFADVELIHALHLGYKIVEVY